MKTLKTMALIGASALAVSAVSTAAAQAQPWHGSGYAAPAYNNTRLTVAYLDRLDMRIAREAQQRIMPFGEARELRSQLRDARPLAWRVQSGRAVAWEVRRLDRTIDRIEAATSRYAGNDRDRGYDHDRDHDGRR